MQSQWTFRFFSYCILSNFISIKTLVKDVTISLFVYFHRFIQLRVFFRMFSLASPQIPIGALLSIFFKKIWLCPWPG